jgi:hypothetical protein
MDLLDERMDEGDKELANVSKRFQIEICSFRPWI